MELRALLRCPACHGELTFEPDALHCPTCDRLYEVIHGIPDFRPAPPDGPRHSDYCLGIIERWPCSSYRELWEFCNQGEPDALHCLWIEHEEEAPQRGERRWEEIARSAEAARRPLRADGAALDLGCGMGSALFAMARRAGLAIGLDILLSDLLLAKKRFADAGIGNVAFVCGSATELPFADESFDLLNATDVVEHMPDQREFLSEARRVMRPGACFFFNSPNRFSLLTPEPHVRLWGVGWLPRRWMQPYVRWRRGEPYRGKRLLSLFELRRLMRSAFARSFAIRALAPRRGAARALLAPIETLAKPILPQHNVLAWK
jgi:ubiquinone/menaquinone biosynthesis C-methylase UbiE